MPFIYQANHSFHVKNKTIQ